MKDFSGSDLLTMVSIDPSDPECIQAFEEFHNRYKGYVWNLAFKKAHNLDKNNCKNVAMILFQNTFMDVHKNAGVFKGGSCEDDGNIKVWLSGIVKNKALQYIQKNNRKKDHIVFMEIVPDEPMSHENENIDISALATYERTLLDRALKTLSDKERAILLSWYNFYEDGKIRNIDKAIKENLAKQFNVKLDSLKKIKERAFKKVLAYIEKNNKK